MCRVAGVAQNRGRFEGEVGVINVLQEGERGTNDPSSCVHDALQGFPHSDTAGQDALNGALVESAHDGWGSSHSLKFAEEVEAPLCCLRQ